MLGTNKQSESSTPPSRKSFADSINIKKIRSNRQFRRGTSFGSPRNFGLKGQLGKIKREHMRTSAANLSKRNLEDIEGMISGEMGKMAHSKLGISRRQAKKLMHQAYKKVKEDSTFTREDYKDMKAIVESIRKKSKHCRIR